MRAKKNRASYLSSTELANKNIERFRSSSIKTKLMHEAQVT